MDDYNNEYNEVEQLLSILNITQYHKSGYKGQNTKLLILNNGLNLSEELAEKIITVNIDESGKIFKGFTCRNSQSDKTDLDFHIDALLTLCPKSLIYLINMDLKKSNSLEIWDFIIEEQPDVVLSFLDSTTTHMVSYIEKAQENGTIFLNVTNTVIKGKNSALNCFINCSEVLFEKFTIRNNSFDEYPFSLLVSSLILYKSYLKSHEKELNQKQTLQILNQNSVNIIYASPNFFTGIFIIPPLARITRDEIHKKNTFEIKNDVYTFKENNIKPSDFNPFKNQPPPQPQQHCQEFINCGGFRSAPPQTQEVPTKEYTPNNDICLILKTTGNIAELNGSIKNTRANPMVHENQIYIPLDTLKILGYFIQYDKHKKEFIITNYKQNCNN